MGDGAVSVQESIHEVNPAKKQRNLILYIFSGIFKFLVIPAILIGPFFHFCIMTRAISPKSLFSPPITPALQDPWSTFNISRYSLWLGTSYIIYHISQLLANLYAKVIGFLVRHHRDRAGILPGTASLLEFSSSLSRYVFLSLWASINWLFLHLILNDFPFLEPVAGTWIFVVSLILLAEKSVLHSIVTSFHRTVYNERVSICMRSLWVVKSLQKMATNFNYSHPASDNYIAKKTIPPFSKRYLVTSFLLENSQLQQTKHPKLGKLFKFLARGEANLNKSHIRPFFTEDSVEEAFRVFSPVLDEIPQAEFIKSIDAVYAERRALVKILGESNDLVRRLDQILRAIAMAIALVLLIPISGLGQALSVGISITPLMVLLTLAFSDTIKSVVAAIVFIFSTHPFDIGDMVYINRSTMYVKQIRLLSTLFRRWDGVLVTYPNSLLSSLPISNVRRTGPQAIRFEVNLSLDKSGTKEISILQERLIKFVTEHTTEFADLQPVVYELRPGLNDVVMVLKLRLRQSYQDPYRRALCFNKFWTFAKGQMEDLGLTFETPILRTNLPDDETATVAEGVSLDL